MTSPHEVPTPGTREHFLQVSELQRWGTIQEYVDLCRTHGYFTPEFYATATAHMERIHVRRRLRQVTDRHGLDDHLAVAQSERGLATQEIAAPGHHAFGQRGVGNVGCAVLRHYLDVEKGDYWRALGRYNGSLGKKGYPELVLAAWRGRWKYDGPTA